MCGIVGSISFGGFDTELAYRRLDAALARLSLRGPDAEGRWHDGRCLLGHRRLAIVDLSDSGRQPMTRGALAIAYNGMIYNYRELRAELETRGQRFASDCDTEVLLAGWQEFGPSLMPRLNGMFAFALWDAEAGRLWLVRDRFGKKPLVWRQTEEGACFASDLRALQLMHGEAGTVSQQSLAAYLALKYVPEPLSILDGCSKVAPGHLVCVDANGVKVERWYHPKPDPVAAALAPAERAPYIRDLVEKATRERLVADVPLAAFLSGGIDSAVVVAAAGRDVKTYTVGFNSQSDYYEERPQARATARHLGNEHLEVALDGEAAVASLDAVFDALDEPFGDSSAVPSFAVARAVKQYATVALSGDGGDEVFGGYRRHQGEYAANAYSYVPALLRRGVIEPLLRALPESKDSWLLERFRRARRFVSAASLPPAERQAAWIRALNATEVDALTGNRGFDVTAMVTEAHQDSGAAHAIDRTLYADLAIVLPGDMLVKVDRMGMANALEVRSPLLDHRVVEAALALPPEAKVARGRGKAVLRDAFADRLPAEVLKRPKKGFELPVANWLMGPLRDLAEDATSKRALSDMGLEAVDIPTRWRDELAANRRDTAERIWTLVALKQWMDRQRVIANQLKH